jgi:hypothetical protein
VGSRARVVILGVLFCTTATVLVWQSMHRSRDLVHEALPKRVRARSDRRSSLLGRSALSGGPQASLERGRGSIEGIVVDVEKRQPIGGVFIELQGGEGEESFTTQSDDNGRFAFSAMRGGRYQLIARGEGMSGHARVHVAEDHARAVRVELTRDVEIKVRVSDDRDQPISGARVQLQRPYGEDASDGSTDARGEARMMSPARSGSFYAEAEGFVPESVFFELEGQSEPHVQIRLKRGRELAFRVLDPDGVALHDAQLQLRGATSEAMGFANTGSTGIARTGRVSSGAIGVRVSAPSWIETEIPLSLQDQREGEVIDLHLQRGLGIHGRLIDSRDRPIAGHVVRAVLDSESRGDTEQTLSFLGPPTGATSTDEQGRFSLSGLSPGRWTLDATFESSVSSTVSVDLRSTDREVEMRVDARAPIEGRVTGASDPRSLSCMVFAFPAGIDPSDKDRLMREVRQTSIATDGQFGFAELLEGDYSVVAACPEVFDPSMYQDMAPVLLESAVRVHTGAGAVELAIASSAEITGEITVPDSAQDLEGTVLAGGHKETFRGSRFVLRGLSAGPKHLEVHVPHYATAVRDVMLHDGERMTVSLALVPQMRIVAHVRDERGSPIAGASLSAVLLSGPAEVHSGDRRETSALSDANGEAIFTGGQPGEYLLTATHERYVEVHSSVSVPESPSGPIEVRMHDGTDLSGVVIRRGVPVAQASISLDRCEGGEENESLPSAQSDGEGRFHLRRLPMSRCRLIAETTTEGSGYTLQRHEMEIDLRSERKAPMVFDVGTTRGVIDVFVPARRLPMHVSLHRGPFRAPGEDGALDVGTTEMTGPHATFEDLESGEYSIVMITGADCRTAEVSITGEAAVRFEWSDTLAPCISE